MSDADAERSRQRPRPQYGEYATPEEQRAAIKQPADWQLEMLETDAAGEQPAPQQPAPGSYRPGALQHLHGPEQLPGQHPQPSMHWPQEESRPPQQQQLPQQRARTGFGDRLITFVLLGFGLANVLNIAADAMQGGRAMREALTAMGASYGAIGNAMPAWLWQGQAVIYVVVWLATLFTSLSSMRRGRMSWWIPVVGAIVAGILFFALFAIALGEHPELLNMVPTPTPGGTGS
jgi:hypothetical protein